jgi:sensor histidine kinase YesM
LLIQPLVENAFEHGFTNREKNYCLQLMFQTEDNYLQISISDDGEGFSEGHIKAESKAMNIIRERLQLLDSKLPEKFSISRENNLTNVRFSLPLVTK